MAEFYIKTTGSLDINPDGYLVDRFSDGSAKTTSTLTSLTSKNQFLSSFTIPNPPNYGSATLKDLSLSIYVSDIDRYDNSAYMPTINMYKVNDSIRNEGTLIPSDDVMLFSSYLSDANSMMNEFFSGSQKGFGKATINDPMILTQTGTKSKREYLKPYITATEYTDMFSFDSNGHEKHEDVSWVRANLVDPPSSDKVPMKKKEVWVGYGDDHSDWWKIWKGDRHETFWIAVKDPEEAIPPLVRQYALPIKYEDIEMSNEDIELSLIDPSNSIFNDISTPYSFIADWDDKSDTTLKRGTLQFTTDSLSGSSSCMLESYWRRHGGNLEGGTGIGSTGVLSGKQTEVLGLRDRQSVWGRISNFPRPSILGNINDTIGTVGDNTDNGAGDLIMPYVEMTLKIPKLAYNVQMQNSNKNLAKSGVRGGVSMTHRSFSIDFTGYDGSPNSSTDGTTNDKFSRGAWVKELADAGGNNADDLNTWTLSFFNRNIGSSASRDSVIAVPFNNQSYDTTRLGVHVGASCTFQDSGDTVTLASHGLLDGDLVRFSAINTTTGISINTDYFVSSSLTNTFKLTPAANFAYTWTSDDDGDRHVFTSTAETLTNDGTGVLAGAKRQVAYIDSSAGGSFISNDNWISSESFYNNLFVHIPTNEWFTIRFYMPVHTSTSTDAPSSGIICVFMDKDGKPLNGDQSPSVIPILNPAADMYLWDDKNSSIENMYLWLENKPPITGTAYNPSNATSDVTNNVHESLNMNIDMESQVIVDSIRFVNFEHQVSNHSTGLVRKSAPQTINIGSDNVLTPLKAHVTSTAADDTTDKLQCATSEVDLDKRGIDKFDLVVDHTNMTYGYASSSDVTTSSGDKYIGLDTSAFSLAHFGRGRANNTGNANYEIDIDASDKCSVWGFNNFAPSPNTLSLSTPISKKKFPTALQWHGHSKANASTTTKKIPQGLWWNTISQPANLGEDMSYASLVTAGTTNNSSYGIFNGTESEYYHQRFSRKGFNTMAGTAPTQPIECTTASTKVLDLEITSNTSGSKTINKNRLALSKPSVATMEDEYYVLYTSLKGVTRNDAYSGTWAVAADATTWTGTSGNADGEWKVGTLLHFVKNNATSVNFFTTVTAITNDNSITVADAASVAMDSSSSDWSLYAYGNTNGNTAAIVKLSQNQESNNIMDITESYGLASFVDNTTVGVKISNMRLSPLGRWHRTFFYNCDSELNLLDNFTFSGVGEVTALPTATTQYGSTFKEALYSPNNDNLRSLGIVPNSNVETATNYGLGAIEDDPETTYIPYPDSVGAVAKASVLSVPDFYELKNQKGLNFWDFDQTLNFGDSVSFLLKLSNPAIETKVTLHNRRNTTKTENIPTKPQLLIKLEDEVPTIKDFKMHPNKENNFYPEFEWSCSDDDAWYGFLLVDGESIHNQYHKKVAHIPLNEKTFDPLDPGDATGNFSKVFLENSVGTKTAATAGIFESDIEGLAGYTKDFYGSGHLIFAHSALSALPSTEMSIVAHITPKEDPSGDEYILFKAQDNNATLLDYSLNITSNQTIQGKVMFDGGTSPVLVESGIIPTDDEIPTCVILTVDTELRNGNVKLFINGKLEDQSGNATSTGSVNNWKIDTSIEQTGEPLIVGASYFSDTIGNQFDGAIEEVVVYNTCIYPFQPSTTSSFIYTKPVAELNSNAKGTAKGYNAKIFIKDYHNIRGTTSNEVATAPTLSWRKASFALDNS